MFPNTPEDDLNKHPDSPINDRGGGKGPGNGSPLSEITLAITEEDGSTWDVDILYEEPSAFNIPWKFINIIDTHPGLYPAQLEEAQQKIAEKYRREIPFI